MTDHGEEAARLAALRRGDAAAFAAFLERYADPIYRLAVGLLDEATEAQDVVQEAFTRILTHLDGFRGDARLDVWLYRVAYNAAISRIRRRRPGLSLDDLDPNGDLPVPDAMVDWRATPDEILENEELRGHLDQAVATLPPLLRAVFILRDVEGLSTAATAAAMGLTEAAVKVRLHRARLALRERLTRSYGVEAKEPQG